MNPARIVRWALALLLLGAATLKLGWPDGSFGVARGTYLGVALVEAALGVGLLVPRLRAIALVLIFMMFLVLVGYGVGHIARSGVGTLAQPCGCLGSAVQPTRGGTLILASVGLAMSAWLAFLPTPGARVRLAAGRVLALLGPLGFAAALAFSWSGILQAWQRKAPQEVERAASPRLEPVRSLESPTLLGRPAEPVRPVSAPAPEVAPRPSVLAVSVREAESRRPLEGVSVWIPMSGGRVATSSAGEARLDIPDVDGPIEVVAQTRVGTWAHATVPAGATSVVIEIPWETRLAGTVHWTTGAPAAGFNLRIVGTGYERAEHEGDPTPAWPDRRVVIDVETDSEGRFTVPGLAEETRVGLRALDERAALLAGGFPDPSGSVWIALPAAEARLLAATGLDSSIAFVDDRTGGPVGGVEATLDWPSDLTDYGMSVRTNISAARLHFLWPLQGGAPVGGLSGRVSARGFEAQTFELRERPETGEMVIRMAPDASGRLTVLHPWGAAISARQPQFSVLCEGRSVASDALGRDIMSLAEEPGQWVFAGLPPGRCSVRCYGVEIAVADLAPGESKTVHAALSQFSRVVLRPHREGSILSGTVRLLTRGVGSLQARELDLQPDGKIEMFPLPVGVIKVSISRSNEVSSPSTFDVEVPGKAETVEIDVPMVHR